MITSVYAALLGLLFICLSVLTIRQRRKADVALGDAGHAAVITLLALRGLRVLIS